MKSNKRIIHVLVVVCLMFLSLITYLLYFNMFQAEELVTNPYNKRQWEDEKFVKRGNIYDSTGVLLAETEVDDDFRVRRYPEGRLYSHIIGYYSRTYGKSHLEMLYDKELLGHGDISISFGDLRSGYDLNLTIDHSLQEYAYEQLGGRQGAIVALEPSTGRILAMVSYPDFDPNTESLEENWNAIVEQENSPLLSRATQGLYPPGSTYKIATAAAAYENGMTKKTFDDTGIFEKDGLQVKNYNETAHGTIDLEEAFAVSSNYAFCSLGYNLGPNKVMETAEKFGVGKSFDFDLAMSQSQIQYKKMHSADAALVSIGQGQLVMTPLHVAMMGASVANDGKMMTPYVVDSITTASGITISSTKPTVFTTAMTPSCASYLDKLMQNVVENGTGRSAQIPGISVAGKTGTAENETDQDHAWFLGYAPADDPQIAVAVLLEYDGGAGGTNAGPIARNVIQKYLGM